MLDHLTTEARNPASAAIDALSPLEIVRLMNDEDAKVAPAVRAEEAKIAAAIEVIADRLRQGGRLIYVGAGTSGRLGVLDAAECPPTFSTPPEMVVGLIAGGRDALVRAVEGAEDHPQSAVVDLESVGLSDRDVLVGIATSGRTPYVRGALEYARRVGAYAIGFSCNPDSQLVGAADLMIAPVVGPEVVSGSTRLKAGTATKLVLNMLTTGAMVLLGKTYGNLMVDLKATNQKLTERSKGIVAAMTGLSREDAERLLGGCGGEVKTAIAVHHRRVSPDEARRLLHEAGGQLRAVVGDDLSDSQKPLPRSSSANTLLLGVEGGGTKTLAWLAAVCDNGRFEVLGRGAAGPSNIQSVGAGPATQNVARAVGEAWENSGLRPCQVAAACLAMAGADRPADRKLWRQWAEGGGVAERVDVVNDALPVLAAGTPEGWGVALVGGTGSFAFARAPGGETARAGGWGYLLGDEGSAYAIALAGLRAAARFADGRGPATSLLDRFLRRLDVAQSEELISAVYHPEHDRRWLAGLADVVSASAESDPVAAAILADAAQQLADLVMTAAGKVGFADSLFPFAVTGGVLLNTPRVLGTIRARLAAVTTDITLVEEPIRGALVLAKQALARS
ncbi:MAG: N-acetylmuramic acid 6-phosphate etherase [Planctomycetes bacterium]|nr:N-acetylmuramic acid 6-phosphate etherase [Planctomycetota bacterium]